MRALIVGAAATAMSVTGSLSSAQAQSCVDALPAFQSVMKSDQPAELVAYLEAYGPCFDAPVKAKLKALGGPPPVTSSATPEGPAGDASHESAADGDAGAALVIPAPAAALRPSDLRLEKRQAGICKAGQACEFEILVYNPSGQDWSGPLFLEESQDANAQSPGWFCSPTGNGESLCLTDRGPRAGETLSLWVEMNLSNRALAQAQNCAELKIDGDDRLLFRMLQAGLAARGYEPGPADGLPGRKTKGALSRFAETQGLDLSFDRPEQAYLGLFGAAPLIRLNNEAVRTCIDIEAELLPSTPSSSSPFKTKKKTKKKSKSPEAPLIPFLFFPPS